MFLGNSRANACSGGVDCRSAPLVSRLWLWGFDFFSAHPRLAIPLIRASTFEGLSSLLRGAHGRLTDLGFLRSDDVGRRLNDTIIASPIGYGELDPGARSRASRR